MDAGSAEGQSHAECPRLDDQGGMAPAEIWAALEVSRQGAMDLLHPLLEAGLVEKVGGNKTGRYKLSKQKKLKSI